MQGNLYVAKLLVVVFLQRGSAYGAFSILLQETYMHKAAPKRGVNVQKKRLHHPMQTPKYMFS